MEANETLDVITNDNRITVKLTPEQWAQVLGMLEQGTQVILAQLATQQGGLQAVTNLSNIASGLIAEIKEQTK